MARRCPECRAEYVFDDHACAFICTRCGHLDDPTQVVLDSHIEHSNSTYQHHPGALATATAHRPIRDRKGWDLTGQSKQAREQRNMARPIFFSGLACFLLFAQAAMSPFINSVLSRLNHPGLSPRVHAIFAQAMTAGRHRWGRRAKLTAGAAMAIALREAHKSDLFRDIAFLLDETPLSISRTFQSVVSLLDLSLSHRDPSVHIPTLHTHLHALLRPESVSSSLPSDLVATLTPLSLPAAVRTATSLSNIIIDHVPMLAITRLPTPPTACALLVLALEAETRTPLPHVNKLASALASRFGVAASVVASRYRFLYDLIEQWSREVPWLDRFPIGRDGIARPKVSKRAIAAKGVKDVIQFHEEIWRKRMEAQPKIDLVIEPDPGENLAAEVDLSSATEIQNSGYPNATCTKTRKTANGDISVACRFLLDPLSSSLSSRPSCRHSQSVDSKEHGSISLATELLARAQEQSTETPTRLQLLAISRGGSARENIADEELFEQGELDSLFRTEEEREALEPLFRLNWGGSDVARETAHPVTDDQGVVKRGSERVDMEALRRMLDGDMDPMLSNGIDRDGCDVDSRQSEDLIACQRGSQIGTEVVELIGDWRPPSPESGFRNATETDRYEEEY